MIGVFDSGLGGLTVVREIFKQLPNAAVVYFGDTARTPYGTKSKETIIKYALEDADFLVKQGAKILVVACNTVSSYAIPAIKEKFNLPVFEVITPAVKQVVKITKGRVGVIGTRATINSRVYEERIMSLRGVSSTLTVIARSEVERSDVAIPSLSSKKQIKVFQQSCPLFVPIVEENWINRPETKMIVRRYLSSLKARQIDTLILGCTHYPFLKDIISAKIGKRVKIIDSAEEVVRQLCKIVGAQYFVPNKTVGAQYFVPHGVQDIEPLQSQFNNIKHKFFVSDLTPHFQNLASKWLGKPVKIDKIP